MSKIGEEIINNQGMKMVIIEYKKYEDITVLFEDGTIVKHRNYGNFKKGLIKNPNLKIKSKLLKDRVGEINYNKYGTKMTIIEYKNYDNITIEFDDKNKTKLNTRYLYFKNGNLASLYDRTIVDVGYIGEGKNHSTNEQEYNRWADMIYRCYDPYMINKNLTYADCFVCEEWHNFQNYYKWEEKEYYDIPNETMNLDKDILIKGNKIYSPDTCILVPHKINMLFVKADKIRGDYPIGVFWREDRHKYVSKISMNNKTYTLGHYDTIDEAFAVYKQHKEDYIKEVADEYKDKIPKKLYNAMYKYKVEITD